MSTFINQQAAQARIAEQIDAAQARAQVREARLARRAERAATASRTRRLRVVIGHVAHA